MKTRERALRDLGAVVAEELAIIATLTPLEAAERAWHPGGPTIEALADTIASARSRTLPQHSAPAPTGVEAGAPAPSYGAPATPAEVAA